MFRNFATFSQLVELNPTVKWMKTILCIILQAKRSSNYNVIDTKRANNWTVCAVCTHCALVTLWSIGMVRICNIILRNSERVSFSFSFSLLFFFCRKSNLKFSIHLLQSIRDATTRWRLLSAKKKNESQSNYLCIYLFGKWLNGGAMF